MVKQFFLPISLQRPEGFGPKEKLKSQAKNSMSKNSWT